MTLDLSYILGSLFGNTWLYEAHIGQDWTTVTVTRQDEDGAWVTLPLGIGAPTLRQAIYHAINA